MNTGLETCATLVSWLVRRFGFGEGDGEGGEEGDEDAGEDVLGVVGAEPEAGEDDERRRNGANEK